MDEEFHCLQLGLHQHALHAFRQALERVEGHPMERQMRAIVMDLEEEVAQAGRDLNRPVRRVERGLRKAELINEIILSLTDSDRLEQIVAALEDEEREALRRVLVQGGRMAWDEFDAAYGNDRDDSLSWDNYPPKTTMGRLRLRGLLVEATVDDGLCVVIPADLRPALRGILVS